MKFKKLNYELAERNMKCTIHKTGKLGFTLNAARKLGLSTSKSLDIGINEDDQNDKNLYMVIYDIINENSLRIYRAGEYYYVDTKELFDYLKYEYRYYTIIFDLVVIKEENFEYVKLIRRVLPRKSK
ncbi:MAG: hypothetical protein HZB41_06815 [Ignavibacteriae bacterium]|nr:hypothetical protein [Ignavibacteriota bacterium]